ncbi:MAG TPA: rhomboid family intramembrane serine protease [Fimbriimonas sp.]|nr:rhomboid family intramembrane serine protease [Fimbriimonas sp.]
MSASQRIPIVTLLLIGANLSGAFARQINHDLTLEFGFRANHPSIQTAFTSLFLHENLIHLLGNLIFLAAVGAAVELATGSLRFAGVYFASGIIGLVCNYLVLRGVQDPAPILGASGCIAGCAGYYSVRYTGLRVPVAPNFSLSVAAITVIWVVLQAVGAVVRFGDTSGVSFWSHLGGFAGGVLISALFRAPDLTQKRLGHKVLDEMNNRGPAAAAAAARKHLKEHPKDPKALEHLARASAQMDDEKGEADAILELLEVQPDFEHPPLLARLVEIGQAGRLVSSKRTMLAEKFKEQHPDVARALLKSVLQESTTDSHRPEAILALAGLERDKEPSRADALLEELERCYPLHPCVDLARKRGWVT